MAVFSSHPSTTSDCQNIRYGTKVLTHNIAATVGNGIASNRTTTPLGESRVQIWHTIHMGTHVDRKLKGPRSLCLSGRMYVGKPIDGGI